MGEVVRLTRPTSFKQIKIRMQQDFAEFGDIRRREFVDDLSVLLGLAADDIRAVRFRKGCVIFEAELTTKTAEKLLELFRKMGEEPDLAELQDFKRFLENYAVKEVTDQTVYAFQVMERRKADERRKPQVVFVHGWRGDEASFGELPKFIAAALDYRCLVYDYPTGVVKKSPSLMYVSANMDNWMREYVDASKVAVVAHSMGGLVLRQFILRQHWRDKPLDRLIKQITFVASPHIGASLAALGSVVPGIQKQQLDEMDPDSPVLATLQSEWMAWCKRHVPHDCQVRSIFGTADSVVSATNALGLDPEAVPILNATHTSIVKPANADDEIVRTIVRFLKDARLDSEDVVATSQVSSKR